eukprot:jgi/Botrbrau1/21211/Bobra.39_2s0012.1
MMLFSGQGLCCNSSPPALKPLGSKRRKGSRMGANAGSPHAQLDDKPLIGRDGLFLWGKRVLLTGPRQYAHKLASLLVGEGARAMWLPCIQITALQEAPDLEAIDQALKALSDYTDIAFTSKNGIYAVLQRLSHLAGPAGPLSSGPCSPQETPSTSASSPSSASAGSRGADAALPQGLLATLSSAVPALAASGIRCWALGADADVLRAAGLADVILPEKASTLGLVAAMESRGLAKGARVLCPVPLVTGGLHEPPIVPRFLEALQAAGAQAVRVSAYETTTGATPQEAQEERGMLQAGHFDAVAFSSTAEAQGLVLACGLAAVQSAVAKGTVLAAHGPFTAAGVSEALGGLPVTVVSRNYSSFKGLVLALTEHFERSAP